MKNIIIEHLYCRSILLCLIMLQGRSTVLGFFFETSTTEAPPSDAYQNPNYYHSNMDDRTQDEYNQNSMWQNQASHSTSYPHNHNHQSDWDQHGHGRSDNQRPNFGGENTRPIYDGYNRGHTVNEYRPLYTHGGDMSNNDNSRTDILYRPIESHHNPQHGHGEMPHYDYPRNENHQRQSDSHHHHNVQYGHNDVPNHDSFRNDHFQKPAENHHYQPHGHVDTHRYADVYHPPQQTSPPYLIPNVDHEHPQLHTKLHDCKCVCDNDLMNPRSINVLSNFGNNLNRNPITWCLLGNPEEGSVPPPTQGRFPDIPRLLEITSRSHAEMSSDSPNILLVPGLGPDEDLFDVKGLLERRHGDEMGGTPCTKKQHVTDEIDEINTHSAEEYDEEKRNPASIKSGQKDNHHMRQMGKPEFRNRHAMSESAVAGLVCGIFAVVVLIVVVVVSRKVIVNKARSKRTEDSDGNSYEDPNGYAKSSSGYPPRYL